MKFIFSTRFSNFDVMAMIAVTILIGYFDSYWSLLLLVPCSFISAHIEKKYGF